MEVAVEEDGKLYVPAGYTLPAATNAALGGVKAKAKTDETVEAAVDAESGKLYVPAYPAIPKIVHQAALEAEDGASIKTAFNSLLTALQSAGLMSEE